MSSSPLELSVKRFNALVTQWFVAAFDLAEEKWEDYDDEIMSAFSETGARVFHRIVKSLDGKSARAHDLPFRVVVEPVHRCMTDIIGATPFLIGKRYSDESLVRLCEQVYKELLPHCNRYVDSRDRPAREPVAGLTEEDEALMRELEGMLVEFDGPKGDFCAIVTEEDVAMACAAEACVCMGMPGFAHSVRVGSAPYRRLKVGRERWAAFLESACSAIADLGGWKGAVSPQDVVAAASAQVGAFRLTRRLGTGYVLLMGDEPWSMEVESGATADLSGWTPVSVASLGVMRRLALAAEIPCLFMESLLESGVRVVDAASLDRVKAAAVEFVRDRSADVAFVLRVCACTRTSQFRDLAREFELKLE